MLEQYCWLTFGSYSALLIFEQADLWPPETIFRYVACSLDTGAGNQNKLLLEVDEAQTGCLSYQRIPRRVQYWHQKRERLRTSARVSRLFLPALDLLNWIRFDRQTGRVKDSHAAAFEESEYKNTTSIRLL